VTNSVPVTKPSRQSAQDLLRNAQLIFLAYAHDDYPAARTIWRRILKLRPGKGADTVFLDQEHLQVASNVEEGQTLLHLRKADLAVVLCGAKTPDSDNVMGEIRQALDQRNAGTTQVLPIILGRQKRLPDGIGNAVQGIFLTNLFPAILWWKRGVIAALLLFSALALWSLHSWKEESLLRQIANQTPQFPSDEAHIMQLRKLRVEAARFWCRKAVATIDEWLRIIPPDDWIEPFSVPSAREAGNSSTQVGKVVDIAPLADGTAIAEEKQILITDAAAREIRRRIPVQRGKIAELLSDPASRAVLARIDYPNFFSEQQANQVRREDDEDTFEGAKISGYESAAWRFPLDGSKPECLGLLTELTGRYRSGTSDVEEWYARQRSDIKGLTHFVKIPADHQDAFSKALNLLGEGGLRLVKSAYGGAPPPEKFPGHQILPLAFDFIDDAQLFSVRANYESEDLDADGMGDYKEAWQFSSWVFRAGKIQRIDDDRSVYASEEPDIVLFGDLSIELGEPLREPAALDVAQSTAVIGNRMIRFGAKLKDCEERTLQLQKDRVPSVVEVTTTPWVVIAKYSNGDIERREGLSYSEARCSAWKWTGAGDWKRCDATRDGHDLLLLNQGGRLVRCHWQLLGKDGWAATATSDKR
jgi:hypothetical protein